MIEKPPTIAEMRQRLRRLEYQNDYLLHTLSTIARGWTGCKHTGTMLTALESMTATAKNAIEGTKYAG